MQIKKINNNQLKVILNSKDLNDKHIDIDSFLANSVESQDLFFEILDLAEEKFDFNIENNKAIVETISLDNNIFVLTITKLKNDLHNTGNEPATLYQFDQMNDILSIYAYLPMQQFYIYKLNHSYYLLLEECSKPLESILSEYATPLHNASELEDILVEYGIKLEKSS